MDCREHLLVDHRPRLCGWFVLAAGMTSFLFPLAEVSAAEKALQPKVLSIIHPHDRVVHGFDINDVAERPVDASGRDDVSHILNVALQRVFRQGGGTLYLPAGRYRLDNPIIIPPGTGLRGDFVRPGAHAVDTSQNTVICAYYGRDRDKQADPLFLLDGSSLLDGMVIWYPEQRADDVVPYAPTIRHSVKDARWAINAASRNVFLVNPYTGIQIGKEGGGTCIQLMKNIYGTPLADGIEVWQDADIPRIVALDFKPSFWLTAELGDRPVDERRLREHLMAHAAGITYHRCDGSELADITIRGYHKGLQLANGHPFRNGGWLDNEGHYINFSITDCHYAVWIQNIKNHGTQFYNSVLEGREAAVYMDNPNHRRECAMFMGCELRGGVAAVMQRWEDQPNHLFSLMFTACTFHSPVAWSGGNLILTDCDFDFEGQHLTIGPKTQLAIVADCRFQGQPSIHNQAGGRFKMNGAREHYIHPPRYDYAVDQIDGYAPPQITTEWITAGDGSGDDASRIQVALDHVGNQGGGYVVLQPGRYVLRQPVTVRANVELRGMLQSWQHSKFLSYYAVNESAKGAVVLVEHGQDQLDEATLILEQGAGIDGLFFHYPGQSYSTTTKQVLSKFGWLIRMQGDRSYAKHVVASNPWRFIDAFTHDPKDVYIGYCVGAPLDQGIRVGEAENTTIDNVHFNSWYWNTVAFPNVPSQHDRETAYKAELDNWMKANTAAFIFAGSRKLNMYGSFVFCAKQGFTLLPGPRSGRGPDGMIINSGNDWSKYGLYMHANNGLVFANMHFIDVAKYDVDPDISSIYVAPGCRDQVRLYNVSTWGDSPRTLSMHGTAQSKVTVYNLSYQLYPDQSNRIASGQAHLISAIRNNPWQDLGFELGDQAALVMHANLFQTSPTITSSRSPVDLDAPRYHPESNPPGVTRSMSFP